MKLPIFCQNGVCYVSAIIFLVGDNRIQIPDNITQQDHREKDGKDVPCRIQESVLS